MANSGMRQLVRCIETQLNLFMPDGWSLAAASGASGPVVATFRSPSSAHPEHGGPCLDRCATLDPNEDMPSGCECSAPPTPKKSTLNSAYASFTRAFMRSRLAYGQLQMEHAG